MDTDGARRLKRSPPSCLKNRARRTDFFHGLLSEAILGIAQCASLAMHDVITHKPVSETVHVPRMVRTVLNRWGESTTDFDLRRDYRFLGSSGKSQHVFDYLAQPKNGAREVAVQILPRTYSPRVQAERYGFLVLDIRDTVYDSWPRIAVISNANAWDRISLGLVKNMSTETVALAPGRESVSAIREIPKQIERLSYGSY